MSEKKREHRQSNPGDPNDECILCFQNKMKHGNLLSLFWDNDILCRDCRRKMRPIHKKVILEGRQCELLYAYDDDFSEILLQYKELCDEALCDSFLYPYREKMKRKYRGFTFVPVPSTRSNFQRRGYDHVGRMFEITGLRQAELFEKEESKDQKHSSMEERKEVGKYIRLKENISVPDTPILLGDDVITSGESMSACLRLLQNHPYEVRAIAVSATKRWFER